VTLAAALAANILHFWLLGLRGPLSLEVRAKWLQASCRRVAGSMGLRYAVIGEIPSHGLVVSNHLSHIDILIYAAIMPAFFVSKVEVKSWPYFGRAARTGGALFVDRSLRSSARMVAQQIAERLALPVPVMLFPEGTSTDGSQVLPFHSGLFEPAVKLGSPVTAAAIRYVVEGGTSERELCWYGDMLFLPHLIKLLGARGFSAEVRFAEPRVYTDRRIAARTTHDEVAAMRGTPIAQSAAEAIPSLSRAD
jgi:1-acyl-sn-glycerol-3-phosphate acyltransferase